MFQSIGRYINNAILHRCGYVLSHWVRGKRHQSMPAAALPKMVGAEIPRLLPGPSGGDGVLVYFGYPHAHERFAENDIDMAVLSDLTRPPTSGRGLSKFWPKKDRESTSPRAWKPLLKGRDGMMGLKLGRLS